MRCLLAIAATVVVASCSEARARTPTLQPKAQSAVPERAMRRHSRKASIHDPSLLVVPQNTPCGSARASPERPLALLEEAAAIATDQ